MVGIVRILFFVFVFFVVLIPIAIVIFLILKGKKQSWKGVIIDKKDVEKEDFDTNRIEHIYKIVVKLDGSRDKYIEVDREKFDTWNIGDRLEKKSGQMWPEIV